jgi:hypothetical protein
MSVMSEIRSLALKHDAEDLNTTEELVSWASRKWKSEADKKEKDKSPLHRQLGDLFDRMSTPAKGAFGKEVAGPPPVPDMPHSDKPTGTGRPSGGGRVGIVDDKQQQEDAEATETGGNTRKRQEDAAKKKKKIQDDLDKWSK